MVSSIYFEENICKIDECKFVVKSPSGGYHLYYNYSPKLKTSCKLDLVSIDVRNDGGLIFAGENYELIKDQELTDVPPSFIDLFCQNKERVVADSKPLSTDAIEMILPHLSNDYVEKYCYWIKLVSVLKNLGYDKEKIKQFSKKSSLVQPDFDKYFDKMYNNSKGFGGAGTLFFLNEA